MYVKINKDQDSNEGNFVIKNADEAVDGDYKVVKGENGYIVEEVKGQNNIVESGQDGETGGGAYKKKRAKKTLKKKSKSNKKKRGLSRRK